MSQPRKNSASHPAEMTISEPENLEEGEGSHHVLRSIKRSVKKVPSEGLIVLSPEPGHVKFESTGNLRPSSSADSTSFVRVGSAGRVEKSLKLARKKELEGEIPRRNSIGAETIGKADDSTVSSVGELKLSEQEERKESPPKTAKVCNEKEDFDSKLSSESDKGDINGGEHSGATFQSNIVEAPVELKGEFLKAVMDEDYGKAKDLCHKILLLEPDNKICSEFHAVIVEKMQQDATDEDEDEDSGDDDDSSSTGSNESGEEDEGQESDDGNSEDDDSDNDESDSDDDFTPPPGPINLIMGGLPIRPQSR